MWPHGILTLSTFESHARFRPAHSLSMDHLAS
jgi:hypothetical protein